MSPGSVLPKLDIIRLKSSSLCTLWKAWKNFGKAYQKFSLYFKFKLKLTWKLVIAVAQNVINVSWSPKMLLNLLFNSKIFWYFRDNFLKAAWSYPNFESSSSKSCRKSFMKVSKMISNVLSRLIKLVANIYGLHKLK